MNILDCEQRSAEWYRARIGSLGASSVFDATDRLKNGRWAATRSVVMNRIIVERLTGVLQQVYVTKAMQDGIDREPSARAAYSFYCEADVRQVGLVYHPTIKGFHCSPDGLVRDEGMVEIKCPTPAEHLSFLLTGIVPEKYVVQQLSQLACCPERKWNDYVSFNPEFPEDLCLKVVRTPRDIERIPKLEDDVMGFLSEVDEKLAALNALREAA